MTIIYSVASSANSETEIRERWSSSIVKITKGVCLGEEKKSVVKKLKFAAVLVIHNEIEEARDVIASALANAKSEKCKKAITNSNIPPS